MSQSVTQKESSEARRRAFVEAATTLFFEQGVEATTMQQIARAAGVSYGLFYHYFPAKEDILTAAVEQMCLLPTFRDFLSRSEVPLEEHLLGFAHLYLKLLGEHREVVWLVFTESRKRPILVQHLQSLGRSMEEALEIYLLARQAAGEVRHDVDLKVLASLIAAQLFMAHLKEEDSCSETPVEEFISLILHGVLA